MKRSWIPRFALAAALALPPATFAAEPVVIGASIALTGPASSLGADESRAFDLAVKKVNAAGGVHGHPLRINVLDGGGDPQRDVLNVRRFITSDHAAGIICCTTTPSSMAVIDTVQRAGVPTISIAASAAIVQPVSERHWIFKTPPLDITMMGPMVRDMKQQGVKTLGFIGFSDAFGQGGLAALRSSLEGASVRLIDAEQFARTDTNVNAQAAKLVAAHPDAVLVWAIPPGANVAQKGLQDAGFKGLIYQNYGVTNETFLRLGGASLNGTRISAQPMVIPDQLPDSLPYKSVIEKFVRDYQAANGGQAPSSFAAQAYDAVMIFAAAANKVASEGGAALPPTDALRSALRDAIENLGQFQGVDGTFNFSATDHVGLGESSAAMIRVKNGAYEFIR